MRHRRKTTKLQRNSSQRRALLSNLTCSLIKHGRIETTVAKAKALRPVAERMVTLGKVGSIHSRRRAAAFLANKDAVKRLFEAVAPAAADRKGGYTRITRIGLRNSDSAPMAHIEWVDAVAAQAKPEPKETPAETETVATEE